MEALPPGVVGELLLKAVAGSGGNFAPAQNIALVVIAKDKDERLESDIALVRRLAESAKDADVRAFAIHLWIKHLEQDPSVVLDPRLPSTPLAVRKATLASLANINKFPEPALLGNAAGGLLAASINPFGRQLREAGLTSLRDREAFERTELCQVLQQAGRATLSRWLSQPNRPLEIGWSLESMELMRMLAAAKLLDEDVIAETSDYLSDVLADQLNRRSQMRAPEGTSLGDASLLYLTMTLVSIHGTVPDEFAKHPMTPEQQQAFAQFRLNLIGEEGREAFWRWMLLFPIETTRSVMEVCGEKIDEEDSETMRLESVRRQLAGSRAPSGPLKAVHGLLSDLRPAIAMAVALDEPTNANLNRSLALMLGSDSNYERLELNLCFPLHLSSQSLFELSKQESLVDQRGYALRLAQLGGLGDDKVIEAALPRAIEQWANSAGDVGWFSSRREFCWLLECLANVSDADKVQPKYQSLITRLLDQRFAGHEGGDMVRGYLATLSLRDRYKDISRASDRLIRASLGMKIDGKEIRWRRPMQPAANQSVWQMMGLVPEDVAKLVLASIIETPPSDPEILTHLRRKRTIAERFGKHPAIPLLDEAIKSMEKNLGPAEFELKR